jgi:hypothetical protein
MTTIWIDAHLSPAIATWITGAFGITAIALRDLGSIGHPIDRVKKLATNKYAEAYGIRLQILNDRGNIGIRKTRKILLPKRSYSFE